MTLAYFGPLLVALVGALVGHYFTRNRETEKFRKDRVTEAYASYLDAVARNAGPLSAKAVMKMAKDEELSNDELALFDANNARFVNAHANVVIYGSKEVIGALSNYYNTIGDFRDPASRDAYIALVHAMRHDSEAEDYSEFGAHVDNILISGPGRRQAMFRSNAALFQPTQGPGSESPSIKPAP